MSPTIYISQDPVLEDVLNRASDTLTEKGWTVIRGPEVVQGVPLLLSADQRQEFLPNADIIVACSRVRISSDDLDISPTLRGLVFPTIGVDAVDLEECAKRGLIVANGAAPENFLAMSEATIMLMLVLLYRLHESERILRQTQPRPTEMYARMLRGRTIGLIGMGRIGSGIVERLAGWHVNEILVHDPYLPAEKAPDGVRLVGLEELLHKSDVVSLHLPLNSQTRGMIDENELLQMKQDAVLINTSRGGLIDEDALVRVMNSGHLAGAGLDVTDTEPLPSSHPLRDLDSVILTPHILGHTKDLYSVMPEVLVDNATRIMREELPLYTRNPELEDIWRQRLSRL